MVLGEKKVFTEIEIEQKIEDVISKFLKISKPINLDINLIIDKRISLKHLNEFIKNIEEEFGISYTVEDEDVRPEMLANINFLKKFIFIKMQEINNIPSRIIK